MKKIYNVLALTLLLGVGGCAATIIGAGAGTAAATGTDSRGFSTVVDDQTLEHKVNSVLGAQIPDGSFTVASYAGQVLVAGQVPNEAEQIKVDTAVANTAGVKKVWNYVTVGKKESFSDISTDTYLTSAAKTRLIGHLSSALFS